MTGRSAKDAAGGKGGAIAGDERWTLAIGFGGSAGTRREAAAGGVSQEPGVAGGRVGSGWRNVIRHGGAVYRTGAAA